MRELFHWYISLFSDPDIKTRLAAWSATIATLSFVITFLLKPSRSWFLNLFKNIKVDAGINHVVILSAFGGQAGVPELSCTITNKSDKSVYIKQPSIKTSKKTNGYDTFAVASLHSKGQYPMKLEPGQQQVFSCNLADLNKGVLSNLSNADSVRFVVLLTTGKRYFSNSFTKKFLIGHLSIAGTGF